MGKVQVWRHVSYEDLDGLEAGFSSLGFDIGYWDALYDGDVPDAVEPDILVVLGAPIGVYETQDFPFINQQIAALQKRLDAGKPVLGVCFGAQLLAAAAGARVFKGSSFEFGWAPIELTEAGLTSPLSSLGENVFHCHGDTFDLPVGAELLARSAQYENQAFRLGPHLGVQFHVEVTKRGLSRWSIGHVGRIKSSIGLKQWSAEIAMHADTHANTLVDFVSRWVSDVMPSETLIKKNGRIL